MGLKKNLLYSILLVLSTYLVPLIVFPYISRRLGPENIGSIDAVDFFINYAILCSMMGLSAYGIREIARSTDNPRTLQQTFSELFVWNAMLTGAVILLASAMIFLIPSFNSSWRLYAIGLVKVLANLFWIEWFFKGIENFRYITLRSIIVRFCFIACVFLFVKNSSDTYVYYFLWVGIVVANALCNWTYKDRFTTISLKNLRLKRHATAIFTLGFYVILCAIYTQLNIVYLGTVAPKQQVGYFTVGTRIFMVFMALFSTMTSVMIPRMSNLLKENNIAEVCKLSQTAFLLLCWFAFPVISLMEFFAQDFIILFAGADFVEAVVPMRIVMPLVFVVGAEQILVQQLLIPLGKDRIVLRNAAAGALTCIIMNAWITTRLQSTGSAIAWCAAEMCVLVLSTLCVRRFLPLRISPKQILSLIALLLCPCLLIHGAIYTYVTDMACRLALALTTSVLAALLYEEYVLRWQWLHAIRNWFQKRRIEENNHSRTNDEN